jgi:hypothetical protein
VHTRATAFRAIESVVPFRLWICHDFPETAPAPRRPRTSLAKIAPDDMLPRGAFVG